MRHFIRHPSDIPIRFYLEDHVNNDHIVNAESLRDVGRGGLCFVSAHPLARGTSIHIEIPVETPPYGADGTVAWCRREGDHFTIGVQFNEPAIQYSLRMVEQVCHIEHYRSHVQRAEGRDISSEEAASEWVEKYAAGFPN
ncbi:PilZ domain-containing protein [Teredinibacter waterburyi]|jgi:PilZ domain.|uniref:PilZ domain-containing protein n=1 Tax=Teredinibacter waterburyi TaxID=1500538 RepID=UPI00165F305F|nr:PilZ domain-containing protein [Teredinibacter waterburyi]